MFYHHRVQRLSVKVILFMCRQWSEESMLAKSALQGQLDWANCIVKIQTYCQQRMFCGHKSFHSGSFNGAGGLGISTADGFQKTLRLQCLKLMVVQCGEGRLTELGRKFLFFLSLGLCCLLAWSISCRNSVYLAAKQHRHVSFKHEHFTGSWDNSESNTF